MKRLSGWKVLLMSELLPNTEYYATYPGNCHSNVGSMRGPRMDGEYVVVTEVSYDSATDKTTIGYARAGFGNKMFANHVLPEAVLNNNGS